MNKMMMSSQVSNRIYKSSKIRSVFSLSNRYNNNNNVRSYLSVTTNNTNTTSSTAVASLSLSSSQYYSDNTKTTTIATSIALGLGLLTVLDTVTNDNTNSSTSTSRNSMIVQCEQQEQEQSDFMFSKVDSSLLLIRERNELEKQSQYIRAILEDAQIQNRVHTSQQQQQQQPQQGVGQEDTQNTRNITTVEQSQSDNTTTSAADFMSNFVSIQATSSRVSVEDSKIDEVNDDSSILPLLEEIRNAKMLIENSSKQQQEHSVYEQVQVQEEQPTVLVQATSAISIGDTPVLVSDDASTGTSTNSEGATDGTSNTTAADLAEFNLEEAVRKAKQHSHGLKIFSGNGNMSLALDICRHLGVNLGKATVGRFADGEVNVVIQENVRGKDVYVVQPTGPPVNDNIMELLLMVSTLRRSSARRITVVIPYYGYARQDRKMKARVPISAADVARLMEAMGVDRVIAVDLHCGQIQGFFGPRVPVDNLDGGIVGIDYFACKDLHNPVIVSPDAGGVYRAKNFKEGLEHKHGIHDLSLAMIVKQRAKAGVVDSMDLVGDVRDCDCIIVDDMIDTAGTLCKAADVLLANGARRVFAFASHGLLSGEGSIRIANSSLEEVVVLNTLPTSPQREANAKLTELNVAPLLSRAIFNIHAKKSISALFR